MGIQHLNSYLKKHISKNAITKIDLKQLAGKKIVIDSSIYLYRFIMEGALLENLYIMITLFQSHNITPLFIFDGIAPPDKTQLLEKRYQEKKDAELEYNRINNLLTTMSKTDDNYAKLNNTMLLLKKKFVKLRHSDYLSVQKLITAFGLKYIEADGEADELCAKLVIKKYAYACLSEDMDLFIYGCPRVLRYFSIIKETVIIYYLKDILLELAISFTEFKEICILSGTDYNCNNTINLYKIFEYFKLYKSQQPSELNFYEWLQDRTDYISNIYQLYSICNIFRTDNVNLKSFKLNIKVQPVNSDSIKEILKPEGFIFIK